MGRSVAFAVLLLAAPLAAQSRFHLRNTFRAGAVDWIEHTQELVATCQINGKPVESRRPLPADAIAIGETWRSQLVVPISAGKAKAEVTNRLFAVKDQRVTVEQKMDMDMSSLTRPNGMTIEVSRAEGLCVFDMRPPMLWEVTALLDMKMDGGGMPTMEIKLRTSLKRIDAPPPKPVAAPKTGG